MTTRPVIAIVMGDPVGIGPELIAKVMSDETLHDRCRPIIIGDITVMRDNTAKLNLPLQFEKIDDVANAAFERSTIEVLSPEGFELGTLPPPSVHPQMGKAAGLYLQLAYELAQKGHVDGVAMAPMNKESFRRAGYEYLDELEFLADITQSPNPFILAAAGSIWAVAVTEHIPFKDIVGYIKTERVLRYIRQLHDVLTKLDFDIPRIAVAALNPHGGEGGLLGREELDEIAPAIDLASNDGINAVGPVPADIVFKQAFDGDFDGVVCMYHDQMNIARKLQQRQHIATLWMGLPVIGATTAHGTAFDIVGQGIADPGSLMASIEHVIKLANSARESQ